jgi:hypothetical protein
MQIISWSASTSMFPGQRSRELADEALRELPDPVDVTQVEAWCTQHGYSWDNDVISRMGGSP